MSNSTSIAIKKTFTADFHIKVRFPSSNPGANRQLYNHASNEAVGE
jgi:hypothetical protein